MHEAKGDVQMEVQMTPLQLSLSNCSGESSLKSTESSKSGHFIIAANGNGNISQVNVNSGSVNSGDESSDDEQLVQTPLKKNRLLESNLNSSILCRSSSPIARMLASVSAGNGMRKDIIGGTVDDQDNNQIDDDEDEDGGKEGGVSNSFTSGENSDAEICPDGDESNGSDMKHDDSRKVFECDVCNMKFSNGANMRRHRMRHSGIKPYECKICKKRFFRKDHLAEHMATHSKLLPFRCPICNKGFQRQIAMRAHFQNEHVGGSHDMVKACPLCSYKAGSMKSLRVHFYSRHGIDLDNPMPHSPLPNSTNANGGCAAAAAAPNGNGGEYSELAHALGFEDRDKSNDSLIPSHFLVPQIEISSNSSFTSQFPFTADSYYNFVQEDRNNGNGGASSPTVSPQSDRSSTVASSSEIVVKKEIMEEQHLSSPEQQPLRMVEDPAELLNASKSRDSLDDVQDSPEDLSSGHPSCHTSGNGKTNNIRRNRTLNDGKMKWKHFLTKRSTHNNSSHSSSSSSAKTSSFSIIKLSPLKSLLREDSSSSTCGKDKSQIKCLGTRHSVNNDTVADNIMNMNNSTNASLANGARATPNVNSNGVLKNNSGHSSSMQQTQPYDGEAQGGPNTASNTGGVNNGNGTADSVRTGAHTTSHSRANRRGGSSSSSNPNLIHQCVYCGIIFPDKTLYFLHKGCHSDSNPWRCNICGEFCYNVYDFNSHLLSKSHQ